MGRNVNCCSDDGSCISRKFIWKWACAADVNDIGGDFRDQV